MPYIRKYKHDCDDCRFLGTVQGPHPRFAVKTPPHAVFDLYFCARSDGGTVIARHGDEGYQYASCPVSMLHKDHNPALLWAAALLKMEEMANG